jgi:predicted membrane protein
MHADPSSNPSSPERARQPPVTSDPWESGRRQWHRHLDRSHHHRGHSAVLGLTVIAWGGLLLMRELGMLPPGLRPLDFWPLLLVGFGVSAVVRWRRPGGVLIGLVVAFFGAGMLAEKLGYVVVGVGHLWPLVIVAAGVALIWRGSARHRSHQLVAETVSGEVLQRSVTMGSLKLVVDSQQFKGAALSATMGEVQLDLRRASIPGEEVAVDLSLVMAGVEIYVPSNWQVVSDISPFMGAVEDRTEPRPDPAGVQKRLVLRGTVTMGAVTIKN